MKKWFEKMLNREPEMIEDSTYYFASDSDGDCFDEFDVEEWRSNSFYYHLHSKRFVENKVSKTLIDAIVNVGDPVIELACGPGMGLIPSIKMQNPKHACLATDASKVLIDEWKKYKHLRKEYELDVDLMQCSILNLPFKDNSISAYTSYIGLSSTRNGNDGYDQAVKEVYRSLENGGYLYTIENEWNNVEGILELFRLEGAEPWAIFVQKQRPWRQRFLDAGFSIEYEELMESRKLEQHDNELGEIAQKYDKEIKINTYAYILKKSM